MAVGCARSGRRASPRVDGARRDLWSAQRWHSRTRTAPSSTSSCVTWTRWRRGHGQPSTCASDTASRTTVSGAGSCWPGATAAIRARTAPRGSRRPLESLRSIGAEYRRPLYLAILAETHRAAGDTDRATSILGAALVTARANEDVVLAARDPSADRGAGAALRSGRHAPDARSPWPAATAAARSSCERR